MFSILVQYADGREIMVYAEEIAYDRNDGVLTLDGEAQYPLRKGDGAFVMNGDGQTVRRYRG